MDTLGILLTEGMPWLVLGLVVLSLVLSGSRDIWGWYVERQKDQTETTTNAQEEWKL